MGYRYEIEVDLDHFTDDDIRAEYESRELSTNWSDDDYERLTKIWLADREGRKDKAYELMRTLVLEKLNKVV